VAPTDIHDVSLPPDTQKPPGKPKLSPGERRRRTDDRLQTIRLRMLIGIVNLAGAIRNSRRYLSFLWQDAQCNACCTSCRLSQCCEISFRFAVS
jgi:hypothetical protein